MVAHRKTRQFLPYGVEAPSLSSLDARLPCGFTSPFML